MVSPAEALWRELGATMRALREDSGRSLRRVEAETGWRRSSLSEVERGRARPTQDQVAYYDDVLGGDGLVASLLTQAHLARVTAPRRTLSVTVPGLTLAWRVEFQDPPSGELVAPQTTTAVTWRLRNLGTQPWSGVNLRRVGAHAGTGLIASVASVALPDCAPGAMVMAQANVTAPPDDGTYRAYWGLTVDGAWCRPIEQLLRVTLTVRQLTGLDQ